jgi:hypothetical protein
MNESVWTFRSFDVNHRKQKNTGRFAVMGDTTRRTSCSLLGNHSLLECREVLYAKKTRLNWREVGTAATATMYFSTTQ